MTTSVKTMPASRKTDWFNLLPRDLLMSDAYEYSLPGDSGVIDRLNPGSGNSVKPRTLFTLPATRVHFNRFTTIEALRSRRIRQQSAQ